MFANGGPVSIDSLSNALDEKMPQVKLMLDELTEEYNSSTHGIAIIRLEDSYQMCSKKEYGEYIRRIMDLKRNTPLSQAALEVLAVIAYNQPVTKAFVEQVRGVDSSSVVASLEEKGLIEEAGRMELPGRPVAFRTTAAFLRCFGLSDLSELPELQPPEEAEETEEEEQLGFDDLTPEEEK